MARKPNPEKAAKHERKGDDLFAKGKFDKALNQYRKAQELHPGRPGIFEKLQKAHDGLGIEWNLEDFAESVSWTMEQQAQEHPEIKQIHAMLSPEWNQAMELAANILSMDEGDRRNEAMEKLVGMGEIATRALLGLVLELKHSAEEETIKETE